MTRPLAIALMLLTAGVAAAQQPRSLDESVALVLRDAAPADVFESFGHMLSLEVDVDPQIDKLLTIHLEDVTARTALQAVCESLGCSWSIEASTLRLTALEKNTGRHDRDIAIEPMDLDLKGASATDFFLSLAQILGADLELDSRVDGTFTIQLDDAGLDEVLAAVCAELECTARVTRSVARPVLEVKPRAEG